MKHLTQAHQLTPRQYRKQFDILSTQKLAAKNYSESRRQMTIDMNLVDGLAKARATKKAAVPLIKTKAPVPMVKEKAAVPAVRIKAPVPAVRMKAAVPAKSAKKK
jgi:hypothetical protein